MLASHYHLFLLADFALMYAIIVQGFVVFVGNATVGNKIRIKVTEVEDRFAKATIV